MNDMPETLEDAIKQLNELRSAYMKRMEDIQELNTEINRLSALLPPEGETRGEQCPKCGPIGCAECYGTGRLSGYQAHANTGEPAPSSEKALRERCEALAKRWDSESGRESFAPVFAEELLEALASSPAPKTFDEAIAQAGGTGIAEFERKAPAPEAPKEEEQFPACVGCKRDGLQRRVGLCQDCGRHVKPDYYERSAT